MTWLLVLYPSRWRRRYGEELRTLIAAHVSSETAKHYGYVKDWPAEPRSLKSARARRRLSCVGVKFRMQWRCCG